MQNLAAQNQLTKAEMLIAEAYAAIQEAEKLTPREFKGGEFSSVISLTIQTKSLLKQAESNSRILQMLKSNQ